ncbi:MAG: phage holin family protein [Myxococcales bacterium]
MELRGDESQGRHRIEELPTGDLFRELIDQSQRLIRQEVRLAKLELRDEAKGYAKGGSLIGGAAVVGQAAFLVLCFCAVFALATAMPGWAAALIVGAVLAAAAAALYLAGRKKVQATASVEPRETVGSLEEDQRWAREMMRRARSQRHASA